ncbi:HAD-IIB family hydrolase [Rhizobium binae]|uniref:HAD superfamily hydrolase (TIGR01484 family) n=2 Tax=Rhizobium binae TaxID=1138190 RepID=A0ABV2MFR5_9HYPH|nr:HAD-IIB family hydrolase [Rhizobium binae]NKL49848.1 HAD-IIB family hydrolase [Rhizobium leguminosarum bv. viciae]MBX4924284.1 HAD-IIB family hydrolase [Rhizobium binae]MBX4935966.1 HAD-IIB family hydrolase [Rhizobium binae]MBX4942005.1 HAD-IIB family hydrolase [Rhizobium binae]MBX4961965.1 HAD-IIB family hydrolase [Rhizobium binae]
MTFVDQVPSAVELQHVRYLFTDIDDTLTTEGKLLPQTYNALWDLSRAGISVVPVTGGSAGWCEHIVRAWPVAAVIGESGAYAVTRRSGAVVFDYWEDGALQGERQRRHLQAIEGLISKKGRTFKIAHDQVFRLADVAIDIQGHDAGAVEELASEIRGMGGTVAISSIHINTWIGGYDKRAMSERLLTGMFGVDPAELPSVTAFVGDSRNDASMFGFIRNSFGVSNILPVLPHLQHVPKWISAQPAGLGFADIAITILNARATGK